MAASISTPLGPRIAGPGITQSMDGISPESSRWSPGAAAASARRFARRAGHRRRPRGRVRPHRDDLDAIAREIGGSRCRSTCSTAARPTEILASVGHVDVLVNNAGSPRARRVDRTTDELWTDPRARRHRGVPRDPRARSVDESPPSGARDQHRVQRRRVGATATRRVLRAKDAMSHDPRARDRPGGAPASRSTRLPGWVETQMPKRP